MFTISDFSWKNILKDEFDKPYFVEIITFLAAQKAAAKIILPPTHLIFNAFNLTPWENIKVVIIGQDPYHGIGQAHGLSFSVPEGIKPPPSLQNIYTEIKNDLGIDMPTDYGNLTNWAQQGVLLLNAVLTVNANQPASHAKIGWTTFTDAVIKKISTEKKGIVFLLWGKFAQEKKALIDDTRHLVLKAPHPSPFSAYTGFYGCKHFSKTNEFLISQKQSPIDWKIIKPSTYK